MTWTEDAEIDAEFALADAWAADALDLSPQEILELALANFPFFCVAVLDVEDKMTQNRVPFRFKPIQRLLTIDILRRWKAGMPVRLIILKARREGVSTLIKAFQFWVCSTRPFRKALTIAHDDETSRALHMMHENFYDWLPDWAQPMRGTSQHGKALEFANPSKSKQEKRENPGLQSHMRTITQANQGAGQGYTLLHLSECALWVGEKGEKTMNTVLQTIPRAAETLVAKESTARGIGNGFHADWVRAVMLGGEGENEYLPVFYAWFQEPTNRAPAPKRFEATEEEFMLAQEFELDDDQLWWRRLTIANECNGKTDIFMQEYPATPDEAFLSSGRPYFNRYAVKEYFDRSAENVAPLVGKFEEVETIGNDTNGGKGWTIFVKSPKQANLRIWAPNNELEDYLIFADAAGGGSAAIADWDTDLDESPRAPAMTRAKDGDWQAAYVIRRSEPEIVAAYHSRASRTDLGDDLYRLGKYYAGVTAREGATKMGAKIAVEVTGGWGEVPLQRLRWRGYPRLYRQVIYDHRSKTRQEILGWHTTQKTKAQMLDSLNQMMVNRELICHDGYLFRECSTFVYLDPSTPNGAQRLGAQEGCHDDRVIAAAGACHLWVQEPRRHKRAAGQPRPALSAVTGY